MYPVVLAAAHVLPSCTKENLRRFVFFRGWLDFSIQAEITVRTDDRYVDQQISYPTEDF